MLKHLRAKRRIQIVCKRHIYRYVYQIVIGKMEYNAICLNDSIHATRHVKLSVNRWIIRGILR